MPELCDVDVARIHRQLKNPAFKKTLMPRQQWVALAEHSGRSAQEISEELHELIQWGALELLPAKDLAQAASDLLPEIEKLRRVERDCMRWADAGTGNAERFLQLALTGHQLSQMLRTRLIGHYALGFAK